MSSLHRIGKNHNRISPFARITADNVCFFNISGKNTARVLLLSEHADDAEESHQSLGITSHDFLTIFPFNKTKRDGRRYERTNRRTNGREEARIDRSNCENEEEENDIVAGWLAGPPAGSGRALV